jgi:hypothetical protein
VIPLPVLEKKAREEISVLCPICLLLFSFRKFKKAGERNKENKMFSLLLFASSLEKKKRVVK